MEEMVTDKLCHVFSQLCGMSDIQSEDLLREDLGLDSLMLVTLMVLLEEEFHIEFLAADLDPFALIMVQDVEELVNRYIAGG